MEHNTEPKLNKNRTMLWFVVIAVIVAGVFVMNRQKESGAIKIGVLSILSGDGAARGESAKRGFDLAG